MKRLLRDIRLVAVLAFISTVPMASAAQDLGSTSGLFKSKSASKKAPAKKKTSKKTNRKKSTTKPKRATKKKSAAKSRKSPTKSRKASTQKSPTRSKTSGLTNKTATSGKASLPKKTVITKSSGAKSSKKQLAANRKGKSPDDIVITVGEKTTGSFSELLEAAIVEGNAARNRRLYLESEYAYRRAVAIDPSDPRAIYGLGNIYSDQQRWEEAEAAYRKALALEPNNPFANVALSYVLTRPVVGSSIGERYAEAEKRARSVILMDPQNAVGYDQLGVAMELRGIISKETEDSYRKAVALDPSFALAYAHIGRLLRKQGKTNESSAAYRKAITLAADVPTIILVADVLQSQQRYLDSEQMLREALRRDPRNPTGLYLLGRALTTRRSFDEAEAVFLKSVEVSPKSFVSYMLLGSLYSQSGNFDRAEETLTRALSVVSENEKKRLAQEFEEVGDGLARNGKQKDAARLYRQAIALDKTKPSLSVKLASIEKGK